MPDNNANTPPADSSWRVYKWGIVAIAVVAMITVALLRNTSNPGSNIAAVVASFAAIVGTLAGYATGSTGKDKADADKQQA